MRVLTLPSSTDIDVAYLWTSLEWTHATVLSVRLMHVSERGIAEVWGCIQICSLHSKNSKWKKITLERNFQIECEWEGLRDFGLWSWADLKVEGELGSS